MHFLNEDTPGEHSSLGVFKAKMNVDLEDIFTSNSLPPTKAVSGSGQPGVTFYDLSTDSELAISRGSVQRVWAARSVQ